MTYLRDPWVWLSGALAFGLFSVFGSVTRRILRYARQHEQLSMRVNLIKTLFIFFYIVAMASSLLFFRYWFSLKFISVVQHSHQAFVPHT